jgi:hypothetical protein
MKTWTGRGGNGAVFVIPGAFRERLTTYILSKSLRVVGLFFVYIMFENCRYKEYLGLDNSFQQLFAVFREEFHAVYFEAA